MITTTLLCASLAVAGFGAFAWRLTGSKPTLANVIFASVALLFAAQGTYRNGANDWSAVIAFLATMVMAGRALGTWVRSRKQEELALTARLLIVASACSLGATAVAAWPLLGLL